MRSVLATLLALGSAAAGVAMASGRRARFLVPLSGLLLAGVVVFGLIPEMVAALGRTVALLLAAAGYLVLFLLDRNGVPVCASCSHGEGFADSLVIATAVHAFADGWGLVAVGQTSAAGVGAAIGTAILLHKIPEGLALGTMLRGSTPRVGKAVVLCLIAESPTVLGGLAGLRTGVVSWVNYALALACGLFLFLGVHAIGQWRLERE